VRGSARQAAIASSLNQTVWTCPLGVEG
jgi:hypothetical protein